MIMAGFRMEDYELTEAINDATGGSLRPSEVQELVKKWILTKLDDEVTKLRRFGWSDEANHLRSFETKLRRGEV